MNREYLGRGFEHTTYTTAIGEKKYVLKKPHAYNAWTLRHFFGGIDTVRKELREAEALVAQSNVKIPPTRVFPFKKGYILSQEFISEDRSVPNIRSTIADTNNPWLLLHAETRPQNFVSHENTIYWLDPTRAPIFRLADKLPIVSEKGIRKTHRMLRKILRKIK